MKITHNFLHKYNAIWLYKQLGLQLYTFHIRYNHNYNQIIIKNLLLIYYKENLLYMYDSYYNCITTLLIKMMGDKNTPFHSWVVIAFAELTQLTFIVYCIVTKKRDFF